MIVPQNSIHLFLSEEEADIVQCALGKYRGPYNEYSVLTEFEIQRCANLVAKARKIQDAIQTELYDRYVAEQELEYKFHIASLEKKI